MPIETVPRGRKTLASVVGVAAAGLLYVAVPSHEGERYVGYLDPIGIPTKCAGDTNDVVVGHRYTKDECRASIETQLIAHAEPVLACVPQLQGHPYQIAAAVDLAYNVGVSRFCRSQTAQLMRDGKWPIACASFLNWAKPDLPGIHQRRHDERALCETEMPQ